MLTPDFLKDSLSFPSLREVVLSLLDQDLHPVCPHAQWQLLKDFLISILDNKDMHRD